MQHERLQKFLARRGVCSRRAAERLILEGRVSVNDLIVAQLGGKIDPKLDRVAVDGEEVPPERGRRVLMLHKPAGFLSTSKTGRETGPTVLELVPDSRRFFTVGRLDRDSTGLLLITDDGDLAYTLTHPRFNVEKQYLVETRPPLTDPQLKLLRQGIELEDGPARVLRAERTEKSTVRLTIAEGRNREIRRMMEQLEVRVLHLHRESFAGLTLGTLPRGKWRELRTDEINRLKSIVPPRT